MKFEDKIRQNLLMRGFKENKLLNNRGLIDATIDEVILMLVKKLTIPDVRKPCCEKPKLKTGGIKEHRYCGNCGETWKQ